MERIKQYLAACVEIQFDNMDCRDLNDRPKAIKARDEAIAGMGPLERLIAKDFVVAIVGADKPEEIGIL